MKKPCKATKILATFLIVVVLLVVFVAFGLSFTVKGIINEIAPQILGTDVKVENVDIRPFHGKVYLDGFVVGAPEGYTRDIFNLTKFNLDFDFKSLFSDTIVINDITIEDPVVVYEVKGITSNISKLMERFESEKEKKDEDKQSDSEKKLIIKHFKFSGGMVKIASSTLGGALPLPLPVIELNDIGAKNGGVTAVEATGEIIYSIGKGVIVAVKDIAFGATDFVGDTVSDTASAIGNFVGGLFGGSDNKEAEGNSK